MDNVFSTVFFLIYHIAFKLILLKKFFARDNSTSRSIRLQMLVMIREGISFNSVVAVGYDGTEVTTGTIGKKLTKRHGFVTV